MLKPENRQRIINFIGIRPGDRVLDVGCGSGELTRYLAQGVDAEFVGIDLDEALIEAANATAHERTSFFKADALSLPFPESSFDVVISHTFFTAVFEAEKAMEQMRIVCKPTGTIASITADSTRVLPHSPGVYPKTPWLEQFQQLRKKLDLAFHKEAARSCVGVLPEDMPRFFAAQGLINVRVQSIEKFCSLSNMSQEERQHYLELEYESECSRLNLLPKQDRYAYIGLLKDRKNDLLKSENTIWDWSGGTNLLVTATNKKPESYSPKDNKLDVFMQAVQGKDTIHATFMRAHSSSFASVMLNDGTGRPVYGAAASPTQALLEAYKRLVVRQYTLRGGMACTTEHLLQNNLPLKTCLKQLNNPVDDTDESYLQELLQWEKEPLTDEFVCPTTEARVHLPRWLTHWCFGEHSCGAGCSPAEAALESLHRTCAQFALKQIVVRQLTPPTLPRNAWESVPEVREAVAVLYQHGIRVAFFDASCGMNLPAIAAFASGSGSAKLRVCCGTTMAETLKNCVASLLEGCTPDRFFTTAARITDQKPSPAQLYNVLTAGEGYIPASILGKDAHWTVRSWQEHACNLEVACKSLQEQLATFGWEIFGRLISGNGIYVYQSIIPAMGIPYDFGNQRLLEYRLHKIAQPILRNFLTATEEQQTLAIKFVSMKRDWLRENSFSYLSGTDQTPRLFGVDVDAHILLGLYHIHIGQLQQACSWLPDSNSSFRCLKQLLRGEAPLVLETLYSEEILEHAQTVLQAPLSVLTADNE